jgi:uncharacterized membrane protein YGL010W
MKPLAEQMAMYSAYHRDPRNRATHFVGVPLIAFSLLLPMALVRFPFGGFDASLAMAFTLGVLVYYFLLDRLLAVLSTVVFGAMLAYAEHLAATLSSAMLWSVFAAAFVGGWIIQLVGHVFEGRKPALVDNFFQIFVAPLFLIAETLFALGVKRELYDAVEARVGAYMPASTGSRVASGTA